MPTPEEIEVDVSALEPEESVELPDSYALKFPIEFGSETLETLTLKPNGRSMQGFKVETKSDGGVVFEPYRFAELGLKLAGQPRAVVDKMHPCDQFGLGMVAMGFFVSGPANGKRSSR